MIYEKYQINEINILCLLNLCGSELSVGLCVGYCGRLLFKSNCVLCDLLRHGLI